MLSATEEEAIRQAKEIMEVRPGVLFVGSTGLRELINEERAKAMGIAALVTMTFFVADKSWDNPTGI